MNAAETYLQLCIRVPEEGATGSIVADWIERAVLNRNVGWAAISDVDVSGDVRPELYATAREIRVMTTSTLLSLLRRAPQAVWASLFFCDSEANAHGIAADETYEQSTAKAVVVIRVVDATELHVIGREEVLRGTERVLPPATIRVGSLYELEFPE